MARRSRRDDEDELDPVEQAGEPTDEEEDELEGFAEVEGDDEVLDFDESDEEDEDLALDEEAEPALDDDEDSDEIVTAIVLDDEDDIAAVVADDDDEDEEPDTLREGEFVCRSCFMAKRESALADPVRMVCRDCA